MGVIAHTIGFTPTTGRILRAEMAMRMKLRSKGNILRFQALATTGAEIWEYSYSQPCS